MSRNHSGLFPENPAIIYMGTPDFSVPALRALIDKGYSIPAVVTQPDRKRGRGKKISFSPVKTLALEKGLNVLQPDRISDSYLIDKLKAYNPDLFIVTAFGQILSPELLSVPLYGAVNIHASLLPRYRGAAPIQWAILNNDSVTGITIMKMDKGLDTGPMLYKEEVPIKKNETTGQLFDRLSDMSGDIIIRFLKDAAEGTITPEPQDNAKASYAKKITRETAVINWHREAVYVASHIRAMDPFPGASTILDDKQVKLFSPGKIFSPGSTDTPGRVTIDDDLRFLVKTGCGTLDIGEIQVPGKKRIPVKDFLRGYSLKTDTILGSR